MRRLKKLLIVSLVFLMAISVLTGCGQKEKKPDESGLIVVDDSIFEPVIDEAEVKAFEDYLTKYDEFTALYDDTNYNEEKTCPFARVIIIDGNPNLDGFEPLGVLTDNYGNTYVQFADYDQAEQFLNV